jgi:calcineurin-like phosphoesterase family protein
MKTWYSADHHFDHANIIKYTNRPFSNVEEMNKELLDIWNKYVKMGDKVYYLGDLCLSHRGYEFLDQMNGDITLVIDPAHHDRRWVKECAPLLTIKGITMCHYPLKEWHASFHGAWHLHGHIHSMGIKPNKNSFDVGIDNVRRLFHEYRPVTFEEILNV